MQTIRRRVDLLAGTRVPVIIEGASGTGKEVLARLIHARSPGNGPFVKINCPGIPGSLLESELFGREKGDPAGTSDAKPCLVETADGGTLLLDEIAELDLFLQAKVLQLVQEGRFSRVGGQQQTRVDVRVICTADSPLLRAIEAGRFRRDLYFRINVMVFQLPLLRQRRQDIPELASYFVDRFGAEYNRVARPLSDDLMKRLLQYEWPGNIRELENLVKRYVILGSEEAVASDLTLRRDIVLNGVDFDAAGTVPLKELTRRAVREFERKIILEVLEAKNWNRKQTARALKLSYRALFYKLREAGVERKSAMGRQAQGSTPGAERRPEGTSGGPLAG